VLTCAFSFLSILRSFSTFSMRASFSIFIIRMKFPPTFSTDGTNSRGIDVRKSSRNQVRMYWDSHFVSGLHYCNTVLC
jgi:hypothetical protein